jgi:hypothetical protein
MLQKNHKAEIANLWLITSRVHVQYVVVRRRHESTTLALRRFFSFSLPQNLWLNQAKLFEVLDRGMGSWLTPSSGKPLQICLSGMRGKDLFLGIITA